MIQWNLTTAFCAFVAITTATPGCEAPRAAASPPSPLSEAPVMRASFVNPTDGEPRLVRVYFNPYTDSIKTVLNYYVNVEGEYSDGTFLPLDTTEIVLRSDVGAMAGNEWVIPKKIDFEKVTFTATARTNPRLYATATLWIQKWKDPRDAADYKDLTEEELRRR
jgi:hypothetical protein